MPIPHARLSAAILALACGAATTVAQTFQVLTPVGLGTGDSQAFNVSADGRFPCGYSTDDTTGDVMAVAWAPDGVPLLLPTYGFFNLCHAVTNNPGIAAGEYDGRAVIWGGGYGADLLLGPGAALDIAPDGAVSVGYRNPSGPGLAFAYRRDRLPSIIDLPPATPDAESFAQAVNGPGTLIAGYTARFEGGGTIFFSRACVWPVAGGAPAVLADVPGHRIAVANDISDDGSVVVGNSACCEESFASAVRWLNGVPTVLTPDEFGNAHAVSADGSVVVGEGFGGAFYWDTTHGMRSVSDILTDAGVDLTGLFLSAARGVSADGSTITGWGFDEDTFASFAWSAVITAPCLADLNGDGLVDFADYLEFLNFYDAEDLTVDFNHDGLVDFSDYLEFLNLYDAGC